MINKKYSLVFLVLVITILFGGCSLFESSHSQPTTAQTVEATQQTEIEIQTTQPSKDEIETLISGMSLEEKIGQMFYVRCPEDGAVDMISKYHLGGYILFGRDFDDKTADEIIQTVCGYQQESKIPMLIGVDEEGGSVVRVSNNTNICRQKFDSPKNIFADGGWNAISDDAKSKANLLLALGINVNMAPVCDVTSDSNAFMFDRSFSADVGDVLKFVSTVTEINKDKKLGTVLKHFPGYGNCEDTHKGIAYDSREYSEFEKNDFEPFLAGINSGADCILAAHNIVNCMDDKYPASLSPEVHRILREQLNFDGVIMTDDLSMQAITDYTDGAQAAVAAAECGNDILCCTDIEVQYPAVLQAAKDGTLPISQIDGSVKRILKFKQSLGLI